MVKMEGVVCSQGGRRMEEAATPAHGAVYSEARAKVVGGVPEG